MNITPVSTVSFTRDTAKPAAFRTNAPGQAAESRKPAKAAGQDDQKPASAPAGLERVLARLQSVPLSEQNAGQANATDRISRNLARYIENQAIGTSSPEPASAGSSTPPAPIIPADSTAAAESNTNTDATHSVNQG